MPKYQLTEKQKNILRAASKGLRGETVKSGWSWFSIPSDTSIEPKLRFYGFPKAKELGLDLTDLHYFARLGFLCLTANEGGKGACDVFEQVIHDAVDNDFEVPDHASHSTTIQTHIHGNVTRSNINTAQYMDNISQTVQSSEFLSPDDKADIQNKVAQLQNELSQYEKTHNREIREVTRSLDIVMGDLANGEPDRQNVTGSLERLKRTGEKLIFAPLAMKLVGEIADKISSIIPG